MPLEIITLQDLEQFKASILSEINLMLNGQQPSASKMMKSTEVCRMLRITPATLQHLRRKKIVNASKIGGTFYYLYDEIANMLPRSK